MHESARAKVNLFLHVVGRRPDGYHLLDSLAVFPAAADRLHATLAADLTLRLDGPFGAGLAAEPDNLVLRAARALRAHAPPAGCVQPGAALTLEKHLPIASGIGGGSADAAATLRLLARLWRLPTPPAALAAIAATLGADVPVCLLSEPSRMGGIGDILGVAPTLPGFGMLLVNPGEPVSTPAVFQARTPSFSAPAILPPRWDTAAAMADALATLANDLEAPAIRLCPAIAATLDWLRTRPGCRLARMSGSGATCLALFDTPDEAARQAPHAPPGWWAWGGAGSAGPHEPAT